MYHWTIEKKDEEGNTYQEYFTGGIRITDGGVIVFRDKNNQITRLLKDWSDAFHTTFKGLVRSIREDDPKLSHQEATIEAVYSITDYQNSDIILKAKWVLFDKIKERAGDKPLFEWLKERIEEEDDSEWFEGKIKDFKGGSFYDFLNYLIILEEPWDIFDLWIK